MGRLRTELRFLLFYKRQQLPLGIEHIFFYCLLHTFLHKISPLNTLDDLLFIRQARLTGESFVQSGSIVGIAQWVVLAKVQEVYMPLSAGFLRR